MLLTYRLREAVSDIWDAQRNHPLVTGIGDGTLDPAIFAFYLKQDYLYLIDYSRVFALCAARAPDLPTMIRFSSLLAETIGTEMDLHRSFSAEFGIAQADFESEPKAPTTQGYTDFLLATAALGDFPTILGALLPCIWGYQEVGLHLAAVGKSPDDRYQRWIEMYAGEEYGRLVECCKDLTNEAAEGLPERLIVPIQTAFRTSARYELAFWEMAWTRETW